MAAAVSGCYLLAVVAEPVTEEDKQVILQRLNKGLLSWDVTSTGCDLKGLQEICENGKEKGVHENDMLIQYSTEGLGVEVLVNPPVSTLKQCVKNLLTSTISHKHIIHSGYTFTGSGSWILQNGTYSFDDLSNAFQDPLVHREKGCTIHIHCDEEGDWTSSNFAKETFTKVAKVSLNPPDKIDHLPGSEHLVDCLDSVLDIHSLTEIMEASALVGNIRFNRPTLYLFPAGQGDCALFGINGFNMLIDGGFSRKPCAWEFIRHLDRLDAVLVTRLSESNLCSMSTLMKRKTLNSTYPQIGYVFCNIAEGKIPSPAEEIPKDRSSLLVSIVGEGHKFINTLNDLKLIPHQCWRDCVAEPFVLYHKVGHGTLEMYVLSPPKDSKEMKDFLAEWSAYKERFSCVKSDVSHKGREAMIPLSHATSVCAIVVWRPNDPRDTITRILFPGSAPQSKIFEGLQKLKSLDILKYPTVTKASLSSVIVSKPKPKSSTPIIKATPPNRRNTASPALSVSSVASRNGDIAGPKKDFGHVKDNRLSKEARKPVKDTKRDAKAPPKELKKDTKELKDTKKETKKEVKEPKPVVEKKTVAKSAPKKVESTPKASLDVKKASTVKKTGSATKKDVSAKTVNSTTKVAEVRKSAGKTIETKTVKEVINKKAAEAKTLAKPKAKPTTADTKSPVKTKPMPVPKSPSKLSRAIAASAAVATAAVTVGVAEMIESKQAEAENEVLKIEVEEKVETTVPEELQNGVETAEEVVEERNEIPVSPARQEMLSPALSEPVSLTASDTLSSAPMETVSPTPPPHDIMSPTEEEKEVNEVKEVDILTPSAEENDIVKELELYTPSVEEKTPEEIGTKVPEQIDSEKNAADEGIVEDSVESAKMFNESVPEQENISAGDYTKGAGGSDLMTTSFIGESLEQTKEEIIVHKSSVDETFCETNVEETNAELSSVESETVVTTEQLVEREVTQFSEKVPEFPAEDIGVEKYPDVDSELATATMEGSFCVGLSAEGHETEADSYMQSQNPEDSKIEVEISKDLATSTYLTESKDVYDKESKQEVEKDVVEMEEDEVSDISERQEEVHNVDVKEAEFASRIDAHELEAESSSQIGAVENLDEVIRIKDDEVIRIQDDELPFDSLKQTTEEKSETQPPASEDFTSDVHHALSEAIIEKEHMSDYTAEFTAQDGVDLKEPPDFGIVPQSFEDVETSLTNALHVDGSQHKDMEEHTENVQVKEPIDTEPEKFDQESEKLDQQSEKFDQELEKFDQEPEKLDQEPELQASIAEGVDHKESILEHPFEDRETTNVETKSERSEVESEVDDLHQKHVEEHPYEDQTKFSANLSARDSDSDNEDVVKSPTHGSAVDYDGPVEDVSSKAKNDTFAASEFSSDLSEKESNVIESAKYESEGKQTSDEKDRDSAEDEEEMIRHPSPPGSQDFYKQVGPDDDDEMRDPIGPHYIPPSSFRPKSKEVTGEPLYEEPEDSGSERSQSPVMEQPVFSSADKADFPELVTLSGGTTPSEPQSPKTPLDAKKGNVCPLDVMEALSEHDCSESSNQSPVVRDVPEAFDLDNKEPEKSSPKDSEEPESDLHAEEEEDYHDEQSTRGEADYHYEPELDAHSEQVLHLRSQTEAELHYAPESEVIYQSSREETTSSETYVHSESELYLREEQTSDLINRPESDQHFGLESEFSCVTEKEEVPSVLEPRGYSDFQHKYDDLEAPGYDASDERFGSTDVSVNKIAESSTKSEGFAKEVTVSEGYSTYEAKEITVGEGYSTYETTSTTLSESERLEERVAETSVFQSSYSYESETLDKHHGFASETTAEEVDSRFLSDIERLQTEIRGENIASEDDSQESDPRHDYSGSYKDGMSSSSVNFGEEIESINKHSIGYSNGVSYMSSNNEAQDVAYSASHVTSSEVTSSAVNGQSLASWEHHSDDLAEPEYNSSYNSNFTEIKSAKMTSGEQQTPYVTDSHYQSSSPEDKSMKNDSPPDVPSPIDPETLPDPLNPLSAVPPAEYIGMNKFIPADDSSADNLNYISAIPPPCKGKFSQETDDPYGETSEDDDSSLPGNVSPYAYTNKAYNQEEDADGNHIYKQSFAVEQTSEVGRIEFDGNNPNNFSENSTSHHISPGMTYSPGFPDMHAADPNYDFRLEEWGKPMGLPTPPDAVAKTAKKPIKANSATNKVLSKSVEKKPAMDNGKSPGMASKLTSSPVKKAKDTASERSHVYVDLAYVPHHGDSNYSSVEFFKKVRARYYVLSGISPSKEVLNALLEAKKSWKENLQVTVIPTYETDTLGYWMAQNQDILAEYSIEVAPSASRCTVNLQDHETSCAAYRLEF